MVVNLGVSGCHLSVTAKTANPIEQNKPNSHPKIVPAFQSLYAIKTIPSNEIRQAIIVAVLIYSLRNK